MISKNNVSFSKVDKKDYFIYIDKTNDKNYNFIRNVKGENYGKDDNRCFQRTKLYRDYRINHENE